MRFRLFGSDAPAKPSANNSTDESDVTSSGVSKLWQTSPQYSALAGEGHRRPPPVLGAPSLIWHIGIWPKRMPGDHEASAVAPVHVRRNDTADRGPPTRHEQKFKEEAEKFDEQNVRFFDELSTFLKGLQVRGRVSPPQGLEFVSAQDQTGSLALEHSKLLHDFRVCQPQSLNFTIWWCDDAGFDKPNSLDGQNPSQSSLRVRIHAQTFVDYATVSLYIDVGKPWSAAPVYDSVAATGSRRKRIFQLVESIRDVAAHQVQEGHIRLDREPESGVSPGVAGQLRQSADYLFDGVWKEFLAAFLINVQAQEITSSKTFLGEIFAESRGVVISTPGLDTEFSAQQAACASTVSATNQVRFCPDGPAAEANVGIGRFASFDNKSGEPNSVIKAHWPFIRRMSYRADDRDFVACGILDWRALLVTPLGSTSDAPVIDEAFGPEWGAPGLELQDRGNRQVETAPRPSRFLLLTKGEPHRQQIGRFVERIVAIETLRLFALRNWAVVRNAGVLIRLLGRELDVIGTIWSDGRQEIEESYWRRQDLIEKVPTTQDGIARVRSFVDKLAKRQFQQQKIETAETQINRDRRIDDLNDLINQVEPLLIALTASLDKIGQGGAGRLIYLLNRSRNLIDEFVRLTEMLEIGNIDTWINYQQFVDRGLKPTFGQINGTFDRLIALRDRIQAITEIVQTSALIVEAEATRSNTKTLRQIASNAWYFQAAIVFTALVYALHSAALLSGWLFEPELSSKRNEWRTFLNFSEIETQQPLHCSNLNSASTKSEPPSCPHPVH